MSNVHKSFLVALSLATASLFPAPASALPYSDLYVFGDSLSDSGNAAFYIDHATPIPGTRTPVPLTEPLVPDYPYASGRLSNGPVWAEYLAGSLGLSAQPSLSRGTNYAFAGSRTVTTSPGIPSLLDQVGSFLGSRSAKAPSNALYVVESGSNDAQDVFATVLAGGDPRAGIQSFAQGVAASLKALSAAGGDHFLLWTVPDIGKTPAFTAQASKNPGLPQLASSVAAMMNDALKLALSGLSAQITDGIRVFDAYSAIDALVGNPGAFGFANATDACAMSADCIAHPEGHFFWDGIHPTTAGHAAIARLALAEIPEPSTLLLLALGLMAFSVSRRRAA